MILVNYFPVFLLNVNDTDMTLNRTPISKKKQKFKFFNITMNEFLETEEKIVRMLKTVFDPEIPVNIYDLGLIYKIDLDAEGFLVIDMTLTAPNCPAVDFIIEDVRMKTLSVEGVKDVHVNIVYEPAWDKSMMSEEAQLELGFL